ncbi:MAG: hypothetical protein AAGI27_14020 [Pseudomonadota bacterium]
MKKLSWQQTAELIGLSAVVISVLLVFFEVRQANTTARATISYELSRDVNEFNRLLLTDDSVADLLEEMRNVDYSPTGAQHHKAVALAYTYRNFWAAQETAYNNGFLTESQFSVLKYDVESSVKELPGLIKYWEAAYNVEPAILDYVAFAPIIQAFSSKLLHLYQHIADSRVPKYFRKQLKKLGRAGLIRIKVVAD